MSEPDDANLDVLKAPLPPRADRDPVNQLRFQLLGYTTALALLITLVPTWLVRDHGRGLQLFTGFGMVRHADILGSAANLLFIAYLVLALVALATPTKLAAFVCAYAGLAVSIVIVLLKPESGSYDEVWWTGAPVLAIGLWLILAVVNTIGWFITRGT
ncbi:hypothetical protein [Kribbella sp. NPDC003557]|uniref:hypothetical protein n=1 Tax=Kribbella sp. NPDC003557 TaxID=3154449 RepID=UPI0033B88831